MPTEQKERRFERYCDFTYCDLTIIPTASNNNMATITALARANEIRAPPPPGAPYSVALEGSEESGRSKIYRHWRFKDGLLQTLDPQVSTV